MKVKTTKTESGTETESESQSNSRLNCCYWICYIFVVEVKQTQF